MRNPVGHSEWEEWGGWYTPKTMKSKRSASLTVVVITMRDVVTGRRAGVGVLVAQAGRQAEVMQAVKLIFQPKEIR